MRLQAGRQARQSKAMLVCMAALRVEIQAFLFDSPSRRMFLLKNFLSLEEEASQQNRESAVQLKGGCNCSYSRKGKVSYTPGLVHTRFGFDQGKVWPIFRGRHIEWKDGSVAHMVRWCTGTHTDHGSRAVRRQGPSSMLIKTCTHMHDATHHIIVPELAARSF